MKFLSKEDSPVKTLEIMDVLMKNIEKVEWDVLKNNGLFFQAAVEIEFIYCITIETLSM